MGVVCARERTDERRVEKEGESRGWYESLSLLRRSSGFWSASLIANLCIPDLTVALYTSRVCSKTPRSGRRVLPITIIITAHFYYCYYYVVTITIKLSLYTAIKLAI